MQVEIEGRSLIFEDCADIWMPTFFGIRLAAIIVQRLYDNEVVLDLGIGSGILSIRSALDSRVRSGVGLDLNPAAVIAATENARLNGVGSKIDVRKSNYFSAICDEERGSFTLLVSNPPTFPLAPQSGHRGSREEWEWAGATGRDFLDAVINEGPKQLRSGGRGLFIATSTQGWRMTRENLNRSWRKWSVIEEAAIPLAAHYAPFIADWRQRGSTSGEELIRRMGSDYSQVLYFIEAHT